jgi:outer membrane protein assembly factor BamD (BamD/ComL family)
MSKRIPLLILVPLLFAQCSLWDSLTAYFNTYYNATRLFSEAEEEVWTQADTRYAGTNWLIRLDPPSSARTRFSSVIEKCSKLLQYHPESDLVDDALMLIAKSYFYQGEVQKCERKCRELLDTHPKSSLCDEARVLLAYALYKMNDVAGGAKIAREVVDRDDASGDLLARALLLLAQDELERQNTGEALRLFEKAGKQAGNGDLRAVGYLRAAESATLLGEHRKAESLYWDAEGATRNYVVEFRATLGVYRSQVRGGEYSEAIRELRALRYNQNYREFFGEIDLATAEAYKASGDLESAIAQYAYVDTAYARSEYGARGGFGLGQIYEFDLKRLDSALSAYNRAKLASQVAEASMKSLERANLLTRYFQFRGELIRCDTLLLASSPLPDSTILRAAGRGDTISVALRDSILLAAAKNRRARLDTLSDRRAFAMSEIANVFYTGLDLRDSAWAWYARVAEVYPASPHAGRALFVIAQILSSDSSGRQGAADSLLREVIRRFPDSEYAAEARRRLNLPAVAKAGVEGVEAYAQAETLILQGQGEAALPLLETIAAKHPNSPMAPRSLYAVGWVYEHQLAQPESSLAAYRRLAAQYPASPAAAYVTPMLAVVDQELKAQVAPPVAVRDSVAAPSQTREAAVKQPDARVEAALPVTSGAAGRNTGRESRLRSRRME